MKKLLMLAAVITFGSASAQDKIEINYGSESFLEGNKECFIISLPNTPEKIADKSLKKLMNDWKGKVKGKKGEYSAEECKSKKMGDKVFYAYGKVVSEEENSTAYLAIEMVGGELKKGSSEFEFMKDELREFAVSTVKDSWDEKLKEEQSLLSDLEKDQKKLEKDKEDLESSIKDYEKKIEEAKQAIKENEQAQTTKKEEIKTQTEKVKATEKTKNSIG